MSWQPSPYRHHHHQYDMYEIQDLKRDDDSEPDVIGIEECYEENTFEERKNTANFQESVMSTGNGLMENVGAHLDKLHEAEHPYDEVIVEEARQSLSFVEDKWDKFFKNKEGQNRQKDEV